MTDDVEERVKAAIVLARLNGHNTWDLERMAAWVQADNSPEKWRLQWLETWARQTPDASSALSGS